jgi:hypothetical protein
MALREDAEQLIREGEADRSNAVEIQDHDWAPADKGFDVRADFLSASARREDRSILAQPVSRRCG